MKLVESITNATHLLLTEKLVAPLGQVNMPSYAGEKDGAPPQFVTWVSKDGSINATLDSIQSQMNRIEPIFAKFPELVPDTKVVYPNVTLGLVEVPHRAADPAIRYHFANEIEALEAGNSEPLAKRNPTSLLFGLWDSRRTQVKVQRVITSSVQVRGAVNQPSASSLSSPFNDDTRQQLEAMTGAKASEIGIDQVPSYRERGTLDTTGATIERRVFLSLSLFDKYEPKLRDYLKGLALVALLYPVSLDLRSGTSLVRQSRQLDAFSDNELSSKQISLDGAFEDALTFARNAAKTFGIGQAETLTVDTKKIADGMKVFDEKKAKKSGKKNGKATAARIGE